MLPLRWIIATLLITYCQCFSIDLQSPINPQQQPKSIPIYKESQLQPEFNSTEYHNSLTCTNNMYQIVEFNQNYSYRVNQKLMFSYQGLQLTFGDVIVEHNKEISEPVPKLQEVNNANKTIIVAHGCAKDINAQNYYNQLIVRFPDQDGQSRTFSLLYNCEYKSRHKKFQFGYLILCVINAAITIGVALHSRIWSIRYNKRPLSLQLKWHIFLILILSTIAVGVAIFLYAKQQFEHANMMLMYLGSILGWFFVFICANEVFFLISRFKHPIDIKGQKHIRVCDVISFFVATIVVVVTLLVENWIMFDFVAICMCVGAIKLFQFTSMKQSIISMAISVVIVTVSTSIMHSILPRSYNDYASQMASPLFVVVPDLINSLFKKCSWLPILDIIVPGVFLSYLRGYDQNYSSKWGGVYTVVGNLSFIIGTMIWIPIQGLYMFSVPFSLVTYPALMLGVSIIAYKRNQLTTLWTGRFNGPHNQFSQRLVSVKQERATFGKMISNDILQEIKIRKQSEKSDIHE